MLAWWGETPETMLGAGLAVAILRIGLWVDGGPQPLGRFGTKVGDGSLDLSQKAMDLVILGWLALILWLLVLRLTGVGALAAISELMGLALGWVRVLLCVTRVRWMFQRLDDLHTPWYPGWLPC